MATKNVSDRGRAGDRPASRIKEAADRIGFQGSEAPADDLDRTDEELDVLRSLADIAEQIFEHHGEVTQDPVNVLTEALRSARDDIATICEAEGAGGGVPGMVYRRAELRIDLALALFEYRQQFGFSELDERPVPMAESAEVSP